MMLLFFCFFFAESFDSRDGAPNKTGTALLWRRGSLAREVVHSNLRSLLAKLILCKLPLRKRFICIVS